MFDGNKKCPLCKTKHAREAMVAVVSKGGSILVCRKCKGLYYPDPKPPKEPKKVRVKVEPPSERPKARVRTPRPNPNGPRRRVRT